jgi:basic amino acid/polyamine antiporter, APA family
MNMPAARPPALNWKDGASLIVGIMLGTGIFTVFPKLAADRVPATGPLLLAWALGTLVALCGAFCYAELTALHPHRGGDYVFLREAFGRGNRGPISFLFAWAQIFVIRPASLVSLSIILAVNARVLLKYLGLPESAGSGAQAAFVYGTPVLFTAASWAGIHTAKGLQNALTAFKVACLAILIGVGLYLGMGKTGNLEPFFLPAGTGSGTLLKDVSMALIPIMWVFGGWNEAPYIAADMKDPARQMPKTLLVGLVGLGILYMLINLVYLLHLKPTGLAGSWTFASDLMGQWFGAKGEIVMAAVLTLSAAGAVNGLTLTGGRMTDAFAEDVGLSKGDVPGERKALLFNLTVTMTIAFLVDSRPESIDRLLVFTAGVVWIFFALVVGSVFVFRRRLPPEKFPHRMPFYPVTPLVFLAMCGAMFYGAWAYKPAETLWGVAVMAAGVPAYWALSSILSGVRAGRN